MPVSVTEACVGGSQVVMLCVGVWHGGVAPLITA